MTEAPTGANLFFLYGALGVNTCLWSILVVFNLWGVISFLRSDSEEKASMLSKAAWAVGFFSFLFGPCAIVAALTAIVLANVERRRIYQDKSTLISAGPVRMANINGGVNLLLYVLLTVAGLASFL